MTRARSMVHMLTVAAARLRADYADVKLIASMEAAAKIAATAIVEGRGFTPEDTARIERQRTLMTMLPDTTAVDRLRAAMLQRAYDLMWDGDCLACDAVCEFLPEADVARMFDAWYSDTTAKKDDRSDFYHSRG